jgi:hypothetical protein
MGPLVFRDEEMRKSPKNARRSSCGNRKTKGEEASGSQVSLRKHQERRAPSSES